MQHVYTIFANSTKRWQILKKNVKGLTPKSLSATRWGSHVDSVKAIRLQLPDIKEVLLEVAENYKDAKIESEAKSLANNELGDFEFLVSIIIWYQMLYTVNLVSKKLQSKDMLLDDAIKEVNMLIEYFKKFRETGLSKAVDDAKELASEMNIDPYKESEKVFGFLFPKKLKEFDDKDLKLCCSSLEATLKYDGRSDLDANELYMELKLINKFVPGETVKPTDVLKYLKEAYCFPNAIIVYKVLLTIPVTVTFAERSFSKLKLLKSYLRSKMSQQRLNGLAMMAIENDILESIVYEELIHNFAFDNVRSTSRFI